MALRGVSLQETEEFIHPDDPGHEDHAEYKKAIKMDLAPEKPTVYKIGNLTQADRVYLGDLTNTPSLREGQMLMTSRNTMRMYEYVKRGLKGWENQLDHEGKPVEFKLATMQDQDGTMRPCVSEESMNILPRSIIFDIAEQIRDKNGMTEDLVKKFSGVSSQPDDQLSETGDVPNVPTNNEQSEDA